MAKRLRRMSFKALCVEDFKHTYDFLCAEHSEEDIVLAQKLGYVISLPKTVKYVYLKRYSTLQADELNNANQELENHSDSAIDEIYIAVEASDKVRIKVALEAFLALASEIYQKHLK